MSYPHLPRYHGHTWLKYTKLIFAIWAISLALGFAGVYIHSGKFVARNVYLHDYPVEGMTRDEVMREVRRHTAVLASRPVSIEADHVRYELTLADFGIRFDLEATTQALFDAGRSLWLKAEALSASQQAGGKRMVEPILAIDRATLKANLARELALGERPVREASLIWDEEKGWQIYPELFGLELAAGELDRLTDGLMGDAMDSQTFAVRYRADYDPVEPLLQASALEGMLEQARALTASPVTVHFGSITDVIDFKTDPARWFTFDYHEKKVVPGEETLKDYALSFAATYNREPSEVTVKGVQSFPSEYNGGTYKKAVIEGDFASGRRVNAEVLFSALQSAFLVTDAKERDVTVPFERVPVVIRSEVPGLEFPGIVSIGESDYSHGNKPNRVHNIKRALELQDLTVIDPGATFSYNEVLGWVTYAKGFVDGQVIFGNSLANVAGGGVCQTSTTMFRAAVNAGLPVVDRKNHSWDVYYYRDWYGVDAAVYPPGKVDLMFVNDTPGPILVHSYVDEENERAYFELYGVHDGRQVRTETTQNYRVGAGRKIVTDWEVVYPNGVVDQRKIVSSYRK